MSNWQRIKLSDCCLSIADGDHQAPPKATSGIPFITISNMTKDHQLDFSNTLFVPPEYYAGIDPKRKAKQGDILYSVVGSFGIPIFINDDKAFAFQRHIAILRPAPEKVIPRFLFYEMLSRDFYAQADAAAIGAAQRTISISALRNMEINLPSLARQKKIVAILATYDDLIENNKRQIGLLEEAAARLYNEYFVRLHFPGYEHTELIDGLPAGWTACQLGDVIEFNPTVQLTKSRLKESIPMSALSTNSMSLDLNNIATTLSNSGAKFQNSDTLLARITPCLENGKTAFVANIESDEGAVGSTEFIVMRSKSLNPYMVYLLARTDAFRQYAINSMTGSDGRQRVQAEMLAVLPYQKPSDVIIELFGNQAKPIFDKISTLCKMNQLLAEARDRLLPRLLSGELDG